MQQTGYQVRFGMGVAGLRACASDADVIIWVDALPATDAPAPDATPSDLLGAAPTDATLLGVDLPTSRAAARWVLDYQTDVQRRLAIAVITASDQFAVEDFLCAGSVIDALSELGLDATSLVQRIALLVATGTDAREAKVAPQLWVWFTFDPRLNQADPTHR